MTREISEPMTGEDAERFVAYIEKPTPPSGHDAYLAEADRAFANIKPGHGEHAICVR